MATANPITVTPTTVPAGGQAAVGVTFQLVGGTPDVTATLTLSNGGSSIETASAVLKGQPGETTPTVLVGNTGVGWEIQATSTTPGVGVLRPGGSANTWTLSAS